ncbi:hypothetical protein BDZ85DRAFT_322254 [Elsinoe ampelina]|uniref:Swi5-dependent recombination DNA repair protein 1 n=1 Tax=Elsinoe ampelina TaxID=302913 RepID=A0A6A6G1E1_9PEZI|nr:hypothetical protein BDZ85DRAFT_322254 [Elsinoe ampelina]
MSTPHAKRRRLNDSASALHRPFRSPLRTVPTTPGQGLKSKSPSRLGASRSVDDSPSAHHDRAVPVKDVCLEREDLCVQTGFHHEAEARKAQEHGIPPSRGHDEHVISPDPADADTVPVSASIAGRTEIPNSEDEASPLSLFSPTLPDTSLAHDQAPTLTPASTFPPPTTDPPHPLKDNTHSPFRPPSPSKPAPTSLSSPTKRHPPAPRQQASEIQRLKDDISLLSSHPSLSHSSSASRAQDLPSLIKTWTRAAQEAADILFPGVKDRVEAAGGMGALRDSSKRSGWDSGGGKSGLDDEGRSRGQVAHDGESDGGTGRSWRGNNTVRSGEERDGRAFREKEEGERRMSRHDGMGEEQRQREAEQRAEEDGQGFTMGVMLKGMNVELDLIGWDEEEGEWRLVG